MSALCLFCAIFVPFFAFYQLQLDKQKQQNEKNKAENFFFKKEAGGGGASLICLMIVCVSYIYLAFIAKISEIYSVFLKI